MHGGIFAGLIDGVGDFAIDVNDPVESNGLVAELHGLRDPFRLSDCLRPSRKPRREFPTARQGAISARNSNAKPKAIFA